MDDYTGIVEYEEEYEKYLRPVPKIWGVSSYHTIEQRLSKKTETKLEQFVEHLPKEGEGDELIFTEIGARYCKEVGEHKAETLGEESQEKQAEYLVKNIIPGFRLYVLRLRVRFQRK